VDRRGHSFGHSAALVSVVSQRPLPLELHHVLRYARTLQMTGSRFLTGSLALAILLVLSACGGGGGGVESGSSAAATVRTLAYAPGVCRENDTQRSWGQELRIRQGEGVDVTVTDATETFLQEPPFRFPGACGLAGTLRAAGFASQFVGGIQRFAVSPDGSTVVFEKTNRFSVIGLPPLAAEREGFFVVGADGSGLRRLGPASRESMTRLGFDASAPGGVRGIAFQDSLSFSADGQTIVFTDRGPGPAGEDAIQITTLDLATGVRTQVTRLPRRTIVDPFFPDTGHARFLSDGTIVFYTLTNAEGLNPNEDYRIATVRPDGTDLKLIPPLMATAGSTIYPHFVITGDHPTSFDYGYPCLEIYLLDRENLLQLTNFCRPDTFRETVDVDGERVFFIASADPLGKNPSENCQLFSIGRLGTDLRQLTDFSQGGHSPLGCDVAGGPPGCSLYAHAAIQDSVTRAIVFPSSCDPFGKNPSGAQIFAMNPDGTSLRQLTNARGFTSEADGTVDLESTGPFASSGERP
jgi:hypothetical protein